MSPSVHTGPRFNILYSKHDGKGMFNEVKYGKINGTELEASVIDKPGRIT